MASNAEKKLKREHEALSKQVREDERNDSARAYVIPGGEPGGYVREEGWTVTDSAPEQEQ
jgi:hypothetical protein